jgi:hypothetical protein
MSLLRSAFWKSYWIALRRSREDKRARITSLRVTLLLFFFLICLLIPVFIGLLAYKESGGVWVLVSYGVMFGSSLLVRRFLGRSNRAQDEMLSYSLTGQHRLTPEGTAYVPQAVRTYLEERMLILNSLMNRASSEIFIQHKKLGPGIEVVTRQKLNALLRDAGLWEKLEGSERDLVTVADGKWTLEQQNEVVTWCEQLRVLRWILGLDAELIPLAHFPKVDLTISHALPGQRADARRTKPMLRSWDARMERDIALSYMGRIVAELKARGVIASRPELDDWADQLRDESLGASKDYLVGSRTIGELNNDELQSLCMTARARWRYAAYLVDQLSAENPSTFESWAENA